MTFEEAKRKARYGHRDYVHVPTIDGTENWQPLTVQNLKLAMLRTGTQRKVRVIAANNAIVHVYSWAMAVLMFRNAKHIGIPA